METQNKGVTVEIPPLEWEYAEFSPDLPIRAKIGQRDFATVLIDIKEGNRLLGYVNQVGHKEFYGPTAIHELMAWVEKERLQFIAELTTLGDGKPF